MSISESEQSGSSSHKITSNSPAPDLQEEEEECSWGDGACGEPLVTHRVSLDFTPNDLDNDFVQRKCCAFWNFINNRPELKNLITVPDPDVYSNESESIGMQSHFSSQKLPSSHGITKTAVNMLEFIEEKGLIDRAFEAKLPKLHCEIDRESSLNKSVNGSSNENLLEDSKGLKLMRPKRKTDKKALPKLRIMCNNMNEWDLSHPKSMKPPGNPPVLQDDINLMKYEL